MAARGASPPCQRGVARRAGGIPPPLGGGFLSERSERNQRIAGGRLSLDAARPNSPYPRTPVYGGRALLAVRSRLARVASGRLLLLTRCRSPQSPGRVLLFVYAAPGYCNIHPFCRARPPGRAAVGAAFGRPRGKPPLSKGGGRRAGGIPSLRQNPSTASGGPPPFYKGGFPLRQNAEGPRFRRKTGRSILTFQPVFGAFRPVFKAFGDFLGHSARYNAPCIGRKS